MMHYQKRNQKLRKYEEKLLNSGCSRITSYTSDPILGRICYVYTLKRQSYYSKSYMREFAGVTKKEDHWHTEPSLKDIGGWVCKRKPKNTPRSVINARGLLQISTNQEGPLIPSLVLDRSLNGAWIL